MLLSKLPDYIEPLASDTIFNFNIPSPAEYASKFVDAALDNFMKIFMHSFKSVLLVIDSYSWEVCLIVGLIALILYIFGWEKAKKIATLSPAIYLILQIFFSVWFGI